MNSSVKALLYSIRTEDKASFGSYGIGDDPLSRQVALCFLEEAVRRNPNQTIGEFFAELKRENSM